MLQGATFKPHAAAVVVIRNGTEKPFLLLRRAEAKLKGVWMYIAGKIEQGETAPQAIIRELSEEAGLRTSGLYTADMNEVYYDRKHDCMRITPVFVAVVEDNAQVVLDEEEHDQFEWLELEVACQRLMPMQ